MANTEQSTQIALFRGKEIRKTLYNNEWWFSVSDVVEALTDSRGNLRFPVNSVVPEARDTQYASRTTSNESGVNVIFR